MATPIATEDYFRKDGTSHLLLNPRLPLGESEIYEEFFAASADIKDHLWILSSGSSRAAGESSKLIGLSKEAFLASAAATNRHLAVVATDRWAVALPEFHVGGLSIHARCLLAGATAVPQPRMAEEDAMDRARAFVRWSEAERITLLSLVPTQIFDLVKAGLRSPPSVRAVMLGGAALEAGLYQAARDLGWPLLPSYGMTETCSNIATASLETLTAQAVGGTGHTPPDRPRLQVLDHIEVRCEADGRLAIRGPSLLTGYWQRADGVDRFTDPKSGGWYLTQDLVTLEGPTAGGIGHRYLTPRGRRTDFVKIKGEGVDLAGLRERFADFLRGMNVNASAVIVDIPDERDGARLVVVTDTPAAATVPAGSGLRTGVDRWNLRAFPLERLAEVRTIPAIPRSELGKVLWAELRTALRHR